MRWLGQILLALISIGFLGAIAALLLAVGIFMHFGKDLPDYSQLKNYEPPIVTRIYAGDGRLLAEYAQERRVFVPIEVIPQQVKNAFLAAEDQNFYTHSGVDPVAIARAAVTNFLHRSGGGRMKGASTITQQVAKNFLLTNERSYERKIKEAILATRMEKAMSKDQILELYLNEIYLGQRSYGVAAAAQTYFNKKLDDLNIAEIAYLAALPKAPNNYHPIRKHDLAVARRNWVIDRMMEDGHVTASEADFAKSMPLAMTLKDESDVVSAPFYAEEVRRELETKYGKDSLYEGGLAVRTSVDPRLQVIAEKALRDGLQAYDKRHGWRGPIARIDNLDDWTMTLAEIDEPVDLPDNWRLAVVLETGAASAKLGLADDKTLTLDLAAVSWARACRNECYALGPEITAVSQVLSVGDVVAVEETGKTWALRQIPKVQGALVAIDPHTGRVLAMQGGWKYSASSQYNRVTQAQRQPGSAFKPFIYLAALDKGFTPATLVLDAPFTMEQSPGNFWKPTNYSGQYYGPTPIRVGVEKSRNLMTVRLADHLGMPTVIEYAQRFGIADEMKPYLSYALGAGETTLMKLTTAYGMIVNGGKKITPTLIDRIQDRRGQTIFSYDNRPCPNCGDLIRWDGQTTPTVPDSREQIADPRTAYQMVSILEGVVQRGTAAKLAALGRPLAGKTGTTNKSKDTWFIGFSPDLVVGVFVGFDQPQSLGKRETGGSAAAPIFGEFMEAALKDTSPSPFRVPPGIKNVRINADTGRSAMPGDKHIIWEAFVTGTEPNLDDYVLDTNVIGGESAADPYAADIYGQGLNEYPNGAEATGAPAAAGQPVYPADDDSLTSFSNERETMGAQPVYPAQENGARPDGESDFTGTGGIY